MAQFDSETGKEAGQKSSRAGIPNKETSRREWIKSFLDDYTKESLKKDFNSLTSSERIKYAIKLMEFDTPKIRNIEEKTLNPITSIRVIHAGENENFEYGLNIPPVKFIATSEQH